MCFRLSVALLSVAALLFGQRDVPELRIVVEDASGAPMVASGRWENLQTGARQSFETDAQGVYTSPPLTPGRHRVEVRQAGFVSQSAVVEVEYYTELKLTMPVGAAPVAVNVVGATPLPGIDRTLEEFPAPVQAANQEELLRRGALGLADLLNLRMNGVYFNEIQGNPMQPDLNYRGYSASPLLGTPQGVSIYMDGVRLNQPFGDVVSWDLIPRTVISEVALIPGSNPLFGLNTLGGALSIRTKDGLSQPGTAVQLGGGSFGRKTAEVEHGGSTAGGLQWYLAGNFFFEDGWRDTSPSNVRQYFGNFGKQWDRTSIGMTVAYANNALLGNGLQEPQFLNRDYASVYTKPDVTANKAPFVNLTGRHTLNPQLTFSGNAYFRYFETHTLNGDINDDSLDQSVYQPSAAERAALTAAGYSGFPTSGESAANTPFPFWRCLGNVLLQDEPAEKCNGLLNRTNSLQRNWGLSGQMSWFGQAGGTRHQLTAGAGYDGNSVSFRQLSELGYLNPDRSVTGVGAFGDGVTGGEEDGEPFDTRVDLSGRIHTGSVYATDTITAGNAWAFTLSGRYNRTSIDNLDRIRPREGTGSLTGSHSFQRFNPAAGLTFRPGAGLNLYFSYMEGSRAPTSIELGCADPEAPCRLPNALAGDPPLEQVVSRTVEAGVRGGAEGRLRWTAGWFRGENTNDILFVASEQTGFGYFKNFGKTRRQGLEVDVNGRVSRLTIGGGYTFLDATFQSPEEVDGTGNSSNEEAQDGIPGVDGTIEIEPGNRIPLVPRHLLKAYADLQATQRLSVSLGLVGITSSFARGNENNQHQADGRCYVGPGVSPGYAVVNLGGRFQIHRWAEVFAQINNLFDRRYYTGAQLGPTGFTATGAFIARPFPAIQGEFPLRQTTFFAPGALRGIWGGLRLRF